MSNKKQKMKWNWENNAWTKWDVQERDRNHKKETNRNFGAKEHMTELKNLLEDFKGRHDQAEEIISEFKDILFEVILSDKEIEKQFKRNKESL